METQEILISLQADTSSALANIRKFRAENERLRAEMKKNKDTIAALMEKGKDMTQEDVVEIAKLRDQNEKLTAAVKQNNQAITDNVKVVELQVAQDRKSAKEIAVKERSLRELRAEAAALTRQYEAMSGADRVGEVGQRVAAQLKKVNEEIRSTTFAVGNFKDNIGNYVSALQGMPGPLGQVGSGIGLLSNGMGGLDKGMKAIMKNPILLLVGLLIQALMKAASAIQKNEELTDRLSEAFASLDPILDLIGKAFDRLAGYLVKFAEWFGNVVTELAGTNKEAAEAVERAKQLRREEKELEKAQRAYIVESAKAEAQVAELRAKAADKERYTATERLRMLDKAIAVETAQAAKRKHFAEERLRLLRLEADRGANDAAANQELAEAEAEVYRETQALNQKVRQLNGERLAAIKAIKEEEKTIQEVFASVARNEQQRRVNAAKKRLDELNETLADVADIEEQAMLLRHEKEMQAETELAMKISDIRDNEVYTEEARNALVEDLRAEHAVKLAAIEDEYAATLLATRQRDEDALSAQLEREAEMVKKTAEAEAAARAEAEKRYQAKRKAILTAGATFSASISDELARQSRAAFEAKKAADIANAITSTYESANGAYSALAGIPIVGPALGAAAAAAAVASGIVNVKNIAETSFGGNEAPTAAASASTPTAVSQGASSPAYNSQGATSLATISAISRPSSPVSGSVTTDIATGVSEAIRDMPSPTVSVTEFESVKRGLDAKRAMVAH